MKKSIIFILLIFFIGKTFCQNQKANLLFLDGTFLEGYGMITEKNEIKFRISLEDEPDIWDNLIVKGITFYGFEISQEYEYIHTKKQKKPELLRIIKKGKITLYERKKVVWRSVPKISKNDNLSNGLHRIEVIDLFMKRKHEKMAILYNRTMKKSIQEYFKDCEVIMDMIKEKEYRKFNRIQLVNYYNVFCDN